MITIEGREATDGVPLDRIPAGTAFYGRLRDSDGDLRNDRGLIIRTDNGLVLTEDGWWCVNDEGIGLWTVDQYVEVDLFIKVASPKEQAR